ncbi:MAG: SusD/RagB family nutrient-binding outer membrane lipoprotein [Gemmatimonadota bacterium]|nr:MAG: SusD/RagB family nutrient-binding outer membrane lipoprotein [Gemmatimonadota bacterium]
MNRMKLARAALVVGLVWAVSACDEGLTDVNQNPNQPTDVDASLLLPNAIRQGVENYFGAGQFLSHTNIWPQHGVELQYPDEEIGNVRSDRMDIYWENYYAYPLMDMQTVINKGVEDEDECAAGDTECVANARNVQAVGMIWKAWLFHIVTDYWGDVPYSEALGQVDGDGNLIRAPAYDSQEAVYAGMLADLTTAANMLLDPGPTDFGGGDLLYGNDFEAWRLFANSLRMRLAMRLSEVDPTTAEAEFAAAYAAGGFESNADNAMLYWPGAPYENPLYEDRVVNARDDHGISETMVDTLVSLNDPRLFYYAEPALNDGQYRGHQNGWLTLPPGMNLGDYSRIGDFWRFDGSATPSMIMSYSEVLFLQAEAAWRGWIAGVSGDLYTEAIRANMNQYDAQGVGPTDTEINDYLAQARVLPDGTLEQILLQKWISLYMNGAEAWADNRRTDVPALAMGPDLIISRIPVRMEYPADEQSYNLDRLNEALARQGMASGVDLVTPVWWDVN